MINKRIYIVLTLVVALTLTALLVACTDKVSGNADEQPQNTQETAQETPAKSTQTPEVTQKQDAEPISLKQGISFSDEETAKLIDVWPLPDSAASDFGEVALQYIDIDYNNDSSYITYDINTDLEQQEAVETFGQALFSKVPDDSFYIDMVTARSGEDIETTLDVIETGDGTLINLNFTLQGKLRLVEDLISTYWQQGELIYEELTDDNLSMQGLSYSGSDSVMFYKIYSPGESLSKEAYEWYKTEFSDLPDFADQPEDFPANASISFSYGECTVRIDDFIDSDLIKISVWSD